MNSFQIDDVYSTTIDRKKYCGIATHGDKLAMCKCVDNGSLYYVDITDPPYNKKRERFSIDIPTCFKVTNVALSNKYAIVVASMIDSHRLWIMNLDTKIQDLHGVIGNIYNPKIIGDVLYYTSLGEIINNEREHRIYKINLETKENVLVEDVKIKNAAGVINFWINNVRVQNSKYGVVTYGRYQNKNTINLLSDDSVLFDFDDLDYTVYIDYEYMIYLKGKILHIIDADKNDKISTSDNFKNCIIDSIYEHELILIIWTRNIDNNTYTKWVMPKLWNL
jgi:hypothetical protein